jgi:hypothetical protein
MRMIKCDRCETINEEGYRFLIFRGSTAHSDKQHELDLCSNCQTELWEFLAPLSKILFNHETINEE